ncbi:UNVERIFIED_CONTAM: hypothetical protein Sangu_0229600 [Sesamum angustifolium]|uniref:Aminotransferase-like plant mobile domain-containing protein n=1 Tax=Sesamum angustifolium TaxID=2727405 RepID=A0AAW2RNW4_9LAMI
MVYFKDISIPSRVQHLVILDYEKQPEDKGTTLMAHTPLIGRYARQCPRLTNPLYMEQCILPTLGRCIIKEKPKWGDNVQFAGEFHYIKGCWEWTEDILSRCKQKLVATQVYDSVYASLFTYDRNFDIIKVFCEAWCPSTNTLLTSFGELPISLWDLHTLAGHLMNGLLYDEVVPCAKEFDGVDETGCRFVPRSCKFLLHAYHLLQGSNGGDQFSQVPIDKWIKFWFKRATSIVSLPRVKRKRRFAPNRLIILLELLEPMESGHLRKRRCSLSLESKEA